MKRLLADILTLILTQAFAVLVVWAICKVVL